MVWSLHPRDVSCAFLVLTVLAVAAAPVQAQTPASQVEGAPPELDPSYQVDMTVVGRRYSLSYPSGSPGTTGNQEGLTTTLAVFQTPLRDDDNPYSVQPFMQRENVFNLFTNAGRFDTANPSGGVDRTEWRLGAGAGFDVYTKRWLAVFGSVSYTYADLHDVNLSQPTHTFGAGAGVGFRLQDTRIDLFANNWVDHTLGSFGSLRIQLGLSVFTVIGGRVSLGATGFVATGGGAGEVYAELFPTKRTGVFVGGFAESSRPDGASQNAKRYAGDVGFSGWLDRSTGFVGRYWLSDENDPATPAVSSSRELSHRVEFEVYLRFS